MSFLKILLFLFIALSFIFVFVVGPISDKLLPQQSKSFNCTTGRDRNAFGVKSCNFISAYLYYIIVPLTCIIGVCLGYLSKFKDDLQAKRFRELIFFVVKALFFSLLLFLVIIGTVIVMGYIVISLYNYLTLQNS